MSLQRNAPNLADDPEYVPYIPGTDPSFEETMNELDDLEKEIDKEYPYDPDSDFTR